MSWKDRKRESGNGFSNWSEIPLFPLHALLTITLALPHFSGWTWVTPLHVYFLLGLFLLTCPRNQVWAKIIVFDTLKLLSTFEQNFPGHFCIEIWENSFVKRTSFRILYSTTNDCSREIKRRLLLGRKVMTNLDSILKSRDIALPTKVHLVKAMVFPVVMYGCESWTIKKAERQRIDENWCFWTVVLEKTLENPLDFKEGNILLLISYLT